MYLHCPEFIIIPISSAAPLWLAFLKTFDNDDVLFLCVQRDSLPFAGPKQSHCCTRWMGSCTDRLVEVLSVAPSSSHRSIISCYFVNSLEASDFTAWMGLFAFYDITVHSQLLTIYLDVIVCSRIKEKKSNREVTMVSSLLHSALQILHFKVWLIGYRTGKNYYHLFKHIVPFSSLETDFDNYTI